jgi:hypothetical protein
MGSLGRLNQGATLVRVGLESPRKVVERFNKAKF